MRLIIILLLVLTIQISSAQDSINSKTTSEVPTELLFKKRLQSNFSISPDGKYYAEVVTNNKEDDIIIVDIDKYKLHKQIPMGRRSVDELKWLTNNRLVFESIGAIYAIDIDGTNESQLVSLLSDRPLKGFYQLYRNLRYNSVLALLPEISDQILIETYDYNMYATLQKINVFTAEKYPVVSGNYYKMNKWIVDRTGKPVLGIKYNDDGWKYFSDYDKDDEWEPLILNIKGKSYPFEVSASSYLDQNLIFEGIGYDENIIYISSNVASDKRVLLAYDLKKQIVSEEVASDINVDISDPDGLDLDLIFDKNSREFAGIRYESLLPQYKWFSSKFRKVHSALIDKFSIYINDIIDHDSENNRFLVHQWSDMYAGNIGVFDIRDSSYSTMIQFNEKLNHFKLSRTRSIAIPNRNKHILPSYLNFPLDYDPNQKYPLVIIPHGGPWARDYWRLDQLSQFFASRGYIAVRINYQGSVGFGKKHVIAGVSGIHTTMIDDIADATRYISSKHAVDKDKIFVFGHSYGGYAAYFSLIRYPELYSSAVAVSAPTDISAWMKYQKKEGHDFSYNYWAAALGTERKKKLKEISPINFVNQIQSPMMIFHGKLDDTIPVEQAEKIKEALDDNNKHVVLRILQNEGHSIKDGNSFSYILKEANEFFENYNKQL